MNVLDQRIVYQSITGRRDVEPTKPFLTDDWPGPTRPEDRYVLVREECDQFIGDQSFSRYKDASSLLRSWVQWIHEA